jgi:hypothetical protein
MSNLGFESLSRSCVGVGPYAGMAAGGGRRLAGGESDGGDCQAYAACAAQSRYSS